MARPNERIDQERGLEQVRKAEHHAAVMMQLADQLLSQGVVMADTARRLKDNGSDQLVSIGAVMALAKQMDGDNDALTKLRAAEREVQLLRERIAREPDSMVAADGQLLAPEETLDGYEADAPLLLMVMGAVFQSKVISPDTLLKWYENRRTPSITSRKVVVVGTTFEPQSKQIGPTEDGPMMLGIRLSNRHSTAWINLASVLGLALVGARLVRSELQNRVPEEDDDSWDDYDGDDD